MINYFIRSHREYESGQVISIESRTNEADIKRATDALMELIRKFDIEEKKKDKVETFYSPIVSFDDTESKTNSEKK